MPVPDTSVTLLEKLAASVENAHWAEFVRRYEEPMRGYLRSRFPAVDEDDVVQETFVALVKRMPGYHYTPDQNGHFRNYLTGILRHKAEDALRRQARENDRRDRLRRRVAATPAAGDANRDWQLDAMHAALEQVLSDASIDPRRREIFRHVAVLHERPDEIAAAFGLTRNAVDQIKHRLIERLQKLVEAMIVLDD